jgi:hypothetical protein
VITFRASSIGGFFVESPEIVFTPRPRLKSSAHAPFAGADRYRTV